MDILYDQGFGLDCVLYFSLLPMRMTSNFTDMLQEDLALSQDTLITILGLNNCDGGSFGLALAEFNSIVETCVLNEIDLFLARTEDDTILIRFVSENDFALYEPELFNLLKCCQIQKAFIMRVKRAIERIGGKVVVAFMDTNHYETWLSVNDFDDEPDLRITWASQQIKGI